MDLPPTTVEVTKVAKSYGSRSVLKEASLRVGVGEVVGVVGENGAGKTTLLRIVVGLLAPNRGTVRLNGRLGYCPQDSLVFERLRVSENLHYFATAYGLCRGPERAAAQRFQEQLLNRFALTTHRKVGVAELSAGTRQKLNLVVSLLHDPDVLVLDEPYGGFDWETYLRFWDYTQEARSRGKSILIVSHLVFDTSQFDRLYSLKDGRLTCD